MTSPASFAFRMACLVTAAAVGFLVFITVGGMLAGKPGMLIAELLYLFIVVFVIVWDTAR